MGHAQPDELTKIVKCRINSINYSSIIRGYRVNKLRNSFSPQKFEPTKWTQLNILLLSPFCKAEIPIPIKSEWTLSKLDGVNDAHELQKSTHDDYHVASRRVQQLPSFKPVQL
jgi:hypothetical protein